MSQSTDEKLVARVKDTALAFQLALTAAYSAGLDTDVTVRQGASFTLRKPVIVRVEVSKVL